MASGCKTFSDDELERIFEIYRTASLAPTTGMPSLREVSRKSVHAEKTIKFLRDENDWEPRRLRILEQVKKKADAKRVRKDVSKVKVYENVEKAGLNFQTAKIYRKNGQAMSDLKITDIIAVGKHVEYLKGNASDRHEVKFQGEAIEVIVDLGDNGKLRKNGSSSN